MSEQNETAPLNHTAVPDTLRSRDQYLMWDCSADAPRRPHYAGNLGISWSNPDAWASFEDVVGQAETRDSWGIGYVTAVNNDDHQTGMVSAIDLDGAAGPDDQFKDWVPSLDPFFENDCYVEWSPSHAESGDSGVHIPVVGTNPPEWFTDTQLSDKEHEGVDLLTNKFCTVTGDKLAQAGEDLARWEDEWVRDWLAEAYENLTGEDPRANETLSDIPKGAESGEVESNDQQATQDDNEDYNEWLDQQGLQDALSHIHPDVAYETWRNIGFALVDHFDDREDADALFREWSKGELAEDHQNPSKWDSDAPELVDKIVEEAKADAGENDVTVGSLVREAKGEGWTPPTRQARTAAGQDDPDDLPTPSAFDVVDGGYAIWHKPRGDDDAAWYEQITNFQLETVSRLTHDDGQREYRLRVHPADADPYVVDVEPAAFNELRTFRRDVLEGWSVTFDGGQSELNGLKRFVARQDAPNREGTKQMGLHGEEFVTPEGSLTADGWTDEPAVVYTDESSQLRPLWQLSPDDDPNAVDREGVAEILRQLPQARDTERFLPVLGWFYAAPLRPLIQDWEGEFNLLNVLGDTGAGKTATLETLWQLFGMDGELLTAETTPFTMLTALSSTNGLPVVFDEYKLADMSGRRKDKLHRYLRTSTKGGIESKGNADRTTDNYHLNAPVCLSGEQPIQGPAEERRTIMTTFTRDGVVGDTPQSRAFARLAGGKAGGEYHDGLPLKDHALAFYTWVLDQDTDELRDLWRESRESAVDVLDRRDLDADVLDDMVVQGFQTIRFGCTLYRAFADEFDVDPDATTVTTDAVADAIAYVAGEGGGADHVSHLDRFVGLLGRAAAAGYVEPGEHYATVDSGVNDTPELRVKLSTAFDQVRRYARDHDVRGEDLLDSVNDYRARIRDSEKNADGYVTTTSRPTRIGDAMTRCVGIDIERADATIENFELGMFTGETVDQDDDNDSDGQGPLSGRIDPQPLGEIDPTDQVLASTIAEVDLREYDGVDGREDRPLFSAHVVDDTGEAELVVWDEEQMPPVIDDQGKIESDALLVKAAKPELYDGELQLVATRGTTIEAAQVGAGVTALEDPGENDRLASTDGGIDDQASASNVDPPTGEFDGITANVVDTLRQNDGELGVRTLARELSDDDTTPNDVESAVNRLSQNGRVITRSDDGMTKVELNT